MSLIYIKECRLTCDVCGMEHTESPDHSAAHLRKVALASGWTYRDSQWFCRSHDPYREPISRLDSIDAER